MQDDASLCEELGFDSLWVAEHRFWYDGWCPQPLVAAAAALGATDRLTVGTAMHLLPQHDPARSADTYAQLRSLFGDRFELGVGLGYRDEEYDGVGPGPQPARTADGRRTRRGDLAQSPRPPIWVGGMAPAAIERAARRGLSLLLPPTLTPADIQRVAKDAAEVSAAAGFDPGRIGMVKDLWITDGTDAAKRQHLDRLDAHYREYGGSWWMLRGALGFARPDLLDKQMQRTADTALVGPLEQIVDELHQLVEAGVSTIALGVSSDFTRGHYRDQMELVAAEVLPTLTAAA